MSMTIWETLGAASNHGGTSAGATFDRAVAVGEAAGVPNVSLLPDWREAVLNATAMVGRKSITKGTATTSGSRTSLTVTVNLSKGFSEAMRHAIKTDTVEATHARLMREAFGRCLKLAALVSGELVADFE